MLYIDMFQILRGAISTSVAGTTTGDQPSTSTSSEATTSTGAVLASKKKEEKSLEVEHVSEIQETQPEHGSPSSTSLDLEQENRRLNNSVKSLRGIINKRRDENRKLSTKGKDPM